MHLEGLAARAIAGEQLVLDIRFAGGSQQRGKPVQRREYLVRDLARLDAARPANHCRHAVGAFPIGVLLAAERRHAAVRPSPHRSCAATRPDNFSGSGTISAKVLWPVALMKALNCRFVTGVRSIQKPSTVTRWTGASSG